ncbi:MAG: electron transfer flavoprotein subunit beta [Anaerolineales bacterium]|nr:electron transfer flavoprotein subunit beta [Anaerolineales bacterium]
MNIVVLLKLVPDLVEEIEIDESGKALDTTFMRLIINEPDEHALEQAILLKESEGGQVTVLGPDVEDMEGVLFTAAAKGSDRQIKLVNGFEVSTNNHALARAFASVISELQPDLVLTGVQAHNDLDGALGPMIAEYLGMPYTGYVAGVSASEGKLSVRKEYPGGLIAEMEVTTPAVLGIQSAEQPPRYVAISKVRRAMKTATIDELAAPALDDSGGPKVSKMAQPQVGERAEMIEGDIDEVASKLVQIFEDLGAR